MHFELIDAQRDFLLELLRNDLSELRGGITRTDNSVFEGRESAPTALIGTSEAATTAP
jgi:hypothetical protein